MRKKAFFSVAILIVVVSMVAWYVVQHSIVSSRNQIMSVSETASNMESRGLMSHADYLRLRELQNHLEQDHGVITDTDLNWLCRLMNSPSKTPSLVHAMVMARYALIKHPTAAQEDTIYQVCAPLLRSNNELDVLYAALVMGALKDRRAVPLLQPLLSDSRPRVLKSAKHALHAIN